MKKYYRTQRVRNFISEFAEQAEGPFTSVDVLTAWNSKYKHHALNIRSMSQMLRMEKNIRKVGTVMIDRNYYYQYEKVNENAMDREV